VTERAMTVSTRRCLPPMVLRLSQGLHQQRLKFIAIQKAELFT
jgi:hypothetical protein